MKKRFKGFGLPGIDIDRTGLATTRGGPTFTPDATMSNQGTFTATRIAPVQLPPSLATATLQRSGSMTRTVAADPVPEAVVIAAPPQKIVVTLPKVDELGPRADPNAEENARVMAEARRMEIEAKAAADKAAADKAALIKAAEAERQAKQYPTGTSGTPGTTSIVPNVEPGDPSLRPMGLTKVDPSTGTGVAAPPQASAESTNTGTIALAVGGLGLLAGVWFFTR